MSRKSPHRKKAWSDRIYDYLFGKMSDKERNHMEQHEMSDPFLADALEGLSRLSKDEYKKDLINLEKRIIQPVRKRQLIKWIAVAASILFVGGISTLLLLLTPEGPKQISENRKPLLQPKEKFEESIHLEGIDSVQDPTLAEPDMSMSEKSGELVMADDLELSEPKKSVKLKSRKVEVSIVEAELDEDTYDMETELSPNLVGAAAGVNVAKDTQALQDLPGDSLRTFVRIPASQKSKVLSESIRIRGVSDSNLYFNNYYKLSGQVTDVNGIPLPGVSIFKKGTEKGTVTNIDGHFEFSDSVVINDVFIASFIGYKPKEFSPDAAGKQSIVLDEELMALDEVVAVGYGKEKMSRGTQDFSPAHPKVSMSKYKKIIESNLDYPASGSGKKELVKVELTISAIGKVEHVRVVETPGEAFSKEVVRKLKEGPEWVPATRDGVSVEYKVKFRLHFYPQK